MGPHAAVHDQCSVLMLVCLAACVAQGAYPKGQALRWFVYWRLFYLACSELFRYNEGEEWGVCHYLFTNKGAANGTA